MKKKTNCVFFSFRSFFLRRKKNTPKPNKDDESVNISFWSYLPLQKNFGWTTTIITQLRQQKMNLILVIYHCLRPREKKRSIPGDLLKNLFSILENCLQMLLFARIKIKRNSESSSDFGISHFVQWMQTILLIKLIHALCMLNTNIFVIVCG